MEEASAEHEWIEETIDARQPHTRRNAWIATGAVVLVAAGLLYRHHLASAEDSLRFQTERIERGRVLSKVTASGTLSALVTVQVGSQVSGRLQRIFVDYNSPVHRHQLIAELDPAFFEAAHQQAKANHVAALGNLDKAEAQAKDAQLQSERAQSLAARALISQADLDTAKANADAARAAVEAAKGAVEQAAAALHQSEINLAYTKIYSPTDGVVISRNVDVGQTVAASLQAPTLFVIAGDLRKMQVDTSVAEADIGRLRNGMGASFTVDAYPGETFHGRVRQIRNAPQTVENVVTYDAVIDIDNPQLKLKPGMTANVTFVTAEQPDVLRLPNAALRFRPNAEVLALAGIQPETSPTSSPGSHDRHGGLKARNGYGHRDRKSRDERRVFVLANGKPRAVEVVTGISDGTVTAVMGGPLHAGDLVVLDASGGSAGAGGSSRRRFGRGML